MEKITIKWLADELHLSKATISKALQNSYEISAETKKRVWELAAKLNYIPNPYASSLRRKTSKTIAVIIPEVADSYFSQAINGIESVAGEKGYHVLVYLTHENFDKEQAILSEVSSGRVDGILMSVTSETVRVHHIQELLSKEVPLILFDRICEEVATIKITTNDYESGYIATQHLLEQGCQRISLLSISSSLSISHQRLAGYQQALKDHNIAFEKSNVIQCTNNEELNYTLIKNLLMQQPYPDGIIATVEKLCMPVYMACQELEFHIPKEVKVIGFSNLKSAMILNPSLTTITQPAFDMGRAAASYLFKIVEKKCARLLDQTMIIPSVLTVRASTGK